MTIRESLLQNYRSSRWVIFALVAAWVTIPLAVEMHDWPNKQRAGAIGVPLFLAMLVLIGLVTARIRCPRCRSGLYHIMAMSGGKAPASCPRCTASFDEPV